MHINQHSEDTGAAADAKKKALLKLKQKMRLMQ